MKWFALFLSVRHQDQPGQKDAGPLVRIILNKINKIGMIRIKTDSKIYSFNLSKCFAKQPSLRKSKNFHFRILEYLDLGMAAKVSLEKTGVFLKISKHCEYVLNMWTSWIHTVNLILFWALFYSLNLLIAFKTISFLKFCLLIK